MSQGNTRRKLKDAGALQWSVGGGFADMISWWFRVPTKMRLSAIYHTAGGTDLAADLLIVKKGPTATTALSAATTMATIAAAIGDNTSGTGTITSTVENAVVERGDWVGGYSTDSALVDGAVTLEFVAVG